MIEMSARQKSDMRAAHAALVGGQVSWESVNGQAQRKFGTVTLVAQEDGPAKFVTQMKSSTGRLLSVVVLRNCRSDCPCRKFQPVSSKSVKGRRVTNSSQYIDDEDAKPAKVVRKSRPSRNVKGETR